MKRALILLVGMVLIVPSASATVIRRVDWVALNYYAMNTWCLGSCLANLAAALDVDVSDPTNLEIYGTIEQRGAYTRWSAGGRSGSFGGFSYSININDGTEYTPLCEDVTGIYSDTMEVGFDFSDSRGLIAYGSGLLCGVAASGLGSFASAEGEFGYWREPLEGAGWMLMARVDSVSERLPEPGTLALFGLSLAGLGMGRRRSAGRVRPPRACLDQAHPRRRPGVRHQ